MDGWVKLYRSLRTKGHLKSMPDSVLRLFVIFLLACERSTGVLTTTYNSLHEETSYGRSTIARALDYLEKPPSNDPYIERTAKPGLPLVIRVLKWKRYQSPPGTTTSPEPGPPDDDQSPAETTLVPGGDCHPSQTRTDPCQTRTTPEPQALEQSQPPDPHKNVLRSKDNKNEDSTAEDNFPQTVLALWNEVCGGALSRATKLTDDRRRHVKARLKDGKDRDEGFWHSLFQRIRDSDFCCGGGTTGWRADFDWAIGSERVVTKILEGKYDNRERKPEAPSRPRVIPTPANWGNPNDAA